MWEGSVDTAVLMNDGVSHTLTPECFRDGCTQRTRMELARNLGIEVVERTIWPEELEGFEQFFLTGSAAEVTPVASAGAWNFEVGELTLQLRKDYLDLVNRRISNA